MTAAHAATAPTPSVSPQAAPLPPDRALRLALDIVAGLPDLPTRTVPLAACHDRVLAERARAETDMPPRDCALADGYVFAGGACRGDGPWRLRLTGRIAAARNHVGANAFPSREAVRITAGASIPAKLDRAVPEAAIDRAGEYVTLGTLPPEGAGIRPRGGAARCGDVIAEPDRLLDPRDIATLAEAGRTGVKVRRGLRVSVLSVGNGRQESSVAPHRAMLLAGLDRRWITRQDPGAVGAGALVGAMRAARDDADMLLAIDRAGMDDAIETAGGRIVLDGVAMRPGGRVRLALLDETLVLILPGDPVDALTAMAVIGWPLLRRRAGIARARTVPRAGVAAFTLAADPGGAVYPLVRFAGAGSAPTLERVEDAGTGALTRLAMADGIALPAPGEAVGFGARIAWVPLNDRFG